MNGEAGRVDIVPRLRGNPLDKLIAELMIHVNNSWGKLLADADAPGLYRVQANGKVKMSTRGGEHQGLGLSHYLWASSPLRRYADLVNQRQILAVISSRRPPYGEKDAELFAVLADFEATYAQYADSLGLKGIRVDRPQDVGRAWDEALAADRPVVFEAITDPDVPTLPPHISFKEAKKFMFSMTKDDDAGHVIKDTARQVLNAVLHKEDAD